MSPEQHLAGKLVPFFPHSFDCLPSFAHTLVGDKVTGGGVGAPVKIIVGLEVGAIVGLDVGGTVGVDVGLDVGGTVGLGVGGTVGLEVRGTVGLEVGSIVGLVVGYKVGGAVGLIVGFNVGGFVVGAMVGFGLGGALVGFRVTGLFVGEVTCSILPSAYTQLPELQHLSYATWLYPFGQTSIIISLIGFSAQYAPDFGQSAKISNQGP